MEDMIRLYERTYKNCLFYQSEGRKVELLNEIGVLRGIVYCIESVIGSDNVYRLINFSEFTKMMEEQQKMKKEGC